MYDNTKTYYCIALSTIGTSEFICTDENENPVLFTTEEAAWKEIADGLIYPKPAAMPVLTKKKDYDRF